MNMNKEQKELLTQIVNDKFQVGPFSGMVFNARVQHALIGQDVPIEQLIIEALNVRLKAQEMIQCEQKKNTNN